MRQGLPVSRGKPNECSPTFARIPVLPPYARMTDAFLKEKAIPRGRFVHNMLMIGSPGSGKTPLARWNNRERTLVEWEDMG